MAGRGRGATLPAWMTANGGDGMNGSNGAFPSNAPPSYNPPGQYDDYNQGQSRHPSSYAPAPAPAQPNHAPQYPQYNSGPPPEQYQARHAQPEPRDRPSADYGDTGSRSNSSNGTGSRIGSWKRGGNRVSNFDVRPPDGVELPPIGVTSTPSGVPNSYFSYANNPAVSGAPLPGTGMQGMSRYGAAAPPAQTNVVVDTNMATRHARRVYAGGIPPRATEVEIANFFNDIITRALLPARMEGPPVQKVYLNVEKCYAFVEFATIELCTACMALDGVRFDHYTGSTIVRIRRPNDYRPELLPPSNAPIPVLNTAVLGITGVASSMSGPGKLFIGGLPYNLTDEQVMELMSAFGPIKAFHQVRDPGATNTKGYGFCEYVNIAHAEAAIAGLNGMALGDKTLTVRVATGGGSNSNASAGQMQAPQMMMGGLGGLGGMGGGMPPPSSMGPAGYGAPAAAPAGMGAGLAGPPPSRVLRLSNMVTRDDLYNEAEYQDIREDVRLECQQYGKVNAVVIPRGIDGYNPAAEGLIFVEFDTVEGARNAASVLNGRKFADKIVVVAFFNEQDFATQRLV